jgi:hypothetical protein
MLQESVQGVSSIMPRRVWYLLSEKAGQGLSSKLKGEVECPDDTSIYQLKKLVLGENKITLGHTDAVNLEVWTHDGDECSADDELSNLTFGDKSKPFIIYYPPGITWNHLIPASLFLLLPCKKIQFKHSQILAQKNGHVQCMCACFDVHEHIAPEICTLDGCSACLLNMSCVLDEIVFLTAFIL